MKGVLGAVPRIGVRRRWAGLGSVSLARLTAPPSHIPFPPLWTSPGELP